MSPIVVRAARRLRRLATDANSRYALWRRLYRPRGGFQPLNLTQMNRYPAIFRFVQHYLGADSSSRLLSFGCSTGEEVFSLRQYFPQATIKGIDINAGNIAIARQRMRHRPDDGIAFSVAGSTAAEPSEVYDAIFCMAVLRHSDLTSPDVTRCDHRLPFADFAAAVEDLARCLKPGGLLVVRHSNFRLCDAPVASAFKTVLRIKMQPELTPLFGPDNRRMPGLAYPDTVFRKLTSATPTEVSEHAT